jgi:hypothetical protein
MRQQTATDVRRVRTRRWWWWRRRRRRKRGRGAGALQLGGHTP